MDGPKSLSTFGPSTLTKDLHFRLEDYLTYHLWILIKHRPPALSFKVAKEYFDNNLNGQSGYELDSDGAFYERTIPESELTLAFDEENDGK